jgi:hypothetical protein
MGYISEVSSVRNWDPTQQPPTPDIVRDAYPPPRYRVAVRRYPANELIAGTSRRCLLIVLSGTCEVTPGDRHGLSAGQVLEIDGGDYSLTSGPEGVEVAMVWDLTTLTP